MYNLNLIIDIYSCATNGPRIDYFVEKKKKKTHLCLLYINTNLVNIKTSAAERVCAMDAYNAVYTKMSLINLVVS